MVAHTKEEEGAPHEDSDNLDGTITFTAFVREIKSWKAASIEEKLGQVFDILDIDSQGELDTDIVADVLDDIYASTPDAAKANYPAVIDALAAKLIAEIDTKSHKSVSRAAFVKWGMQAPLLVPVLSVDIFS